MTPTPTTTSAAELVRELLHLTPPPNAARLGKHLALSATHVSVPGPNLDHPDWATETSSGYTFLTLTGDIRGVTIWDDPRGWGTYAKIYVATAALADIERVIGATKPTPRAPGDTRSGDKVAAYPKIDGRAFRVFVEHRNGAVASILIDFGKP